MSYKTRVTYGAFTRIEKESYPLAQDREIGDIVADTEVVTVESGRYGRQLCFHIKGGNSQYYKLSKDSDLEPGQLIKDASKIKIYHVSKGDSVLEIMDINKADL